MSWFKHIPPKYPPNHTSPPPQRTSPATEKSLKAAKKTGPKKK
jgi:hypothetical protein